MRTSLRSVNDHGAHYKALMFVCPGCVAGAKAKGKDGYEGLHMLPVNAPDIEKPSWDWNGNREKPTLSPSVLTNGGVAGKNAICHMFLRDGVFEFLDDCTHPLAGKKVPIPDLPGWAVHEDDD